VAREKVLIIPREYTTLVMLKKFIEEEKAKASLEHMVYAGGIVVCLIFILLMYSSYFDALKSCGDHPRCP